MPGSSSWTRCVRFAHPAEADQKHDAMTGFWRDCVQDCHSQITFCNARVRLFFRFLMWQKKQDLAEGEEPNAETNESIWRMLRVPRAEFEARRQRHASKQGGGKRPPPPYNDK